MSTKHAKRDFVYMSSVIFITKPKLFVNNDEREVFFTLFVTEEDKIDNFISLELIRNI